jgi:hypothetical protein
MMELRKIIFGWRVAGLDGDEQAIAETTEKKRERGGVVVS